MSVLYKFGLTPELLIILAIDLSIAVALLTAMRYLQAWSIQVNSSHELASRDNFAFGISTAGAVLGLGIVLTGAMTGAAAPSYAIEAIGMSAYGIGGLVLIKFGRFLQDKITLSSFDKNAQIAKGNVAVAIVDAGYVIATAIIIRSVLMWVEDLTLNTLIAVLSAFLISQLMLLLLTRLREQRFVRRNGNMPMQQALEQGYIAVALRHVGYLIAMALTFKAASHFIVYEPSTYISNAIGWLVFSLVMLVILNVLLALVKRVILANIDTAKEVEQEHNIGIAAVEMAISIAIALLLAALMA